MLLREGSFIDASTFGLGNAGNIDIEVQTNISLIDGQIITNTVGGGNSGDIKINASSAVLSLDGIGASEAMIATSASGQRLVSIDNPQAGDIDIDVKLLTLNNIAEINTLTF